MSLPSALAEENGMARVFYDEMYDASGACRPHYREFARWLARTPGEQLARRREEADLLFHRAGITFTLYGDEQGTERLIPFDTIPRSIPAREWKTIEQGCIQRVKERNCLSRRAQVRGSTLAWLSRRAHWAMTSRVRGPRWRVRRTYSAKLRRL